MFSYSFPPKIVRRRGEERKGRGRGNEIIPFLIQEFHVSHYLPKNWGRGGFRLSEFFLIIFFIIRHSLSTGEEGRESGDHKRNKGERRRKKMERAERASFSSIPGDEVYVGDRWRDGDDDDDYGDRPGGGAAPSPMSWRNSCPIVREEEGGGGGGDDTDDPGVRESRTNDGGGDGDDDDIVVLISDDDGGGGGKSGDGVAAMTIDPASIESKAPSPSFGNLDPSILSAVFS